MLNGIAVFNYVILQNDIFCMFIVLSIRAKSFWCWLMEMITHPTLVQLVSSGAVRSVVAVSHARGWVLIVRYGSAERALAAQRSKQLRFFRKLDTLVGYLSLIGVHRFEVDAISFV